MELAVDKCAILNIRGPEKDFELWNQNLESLEAVKDLGINVSKKLTWSALIISRLKKENRVLYLIRRNVAYAVKPFIKLGLYKSLVLPVLFYGINYTPSKSDLKNLEKLQLKAVRWITGQNEPYENQLRLLNILPLPMYMLMNNLLTLSKITQERRDDIAITEINKVRRRSTELYTLRKVRLKKAQNEFIFKKGRLANRIDNEINFMEPRGLKNRILNLKWKFFNKSFNTQNICTWQLCCDCHRCRLTDISLKAILKDWNETSTSSLKLPTTTATTIKILRLVQVWTKFLTALNRKFYSPIELFVLFKIKVLLEELRKRWLNWIWIELHRP